MTEKDDPSRSKSRGYYWMVAFIVFVICSSGSLATINYLHKNSYCISELRYVSNQEMIDGAIAYVMRPINALAAHGHGLNPGEQYIAYRDISEFKEVNPDCCKVLSGEEERLNVRPLYSSLDRIFGAYSVVVQVDYKIRYKTTSGLELERKEQTIAPVSACGRVVLEGLSRS